MDKLKVRSTAKDSSDRGPQAAIVAMDQEAVQIFLKGESGDPAQVIERLEERQLAEEGSNNNVVL